MQYLLCLYGDQTASLAAFEQEAQAAGVLVQQVALQPAEAAVTLLASGEEPSELEAPTSQPAAQLGACYLLECGAMAEAIKWASRIPLVGRGGFGSIEVRPALG